MIKIFKINKINIKFYIKFIEIFGHKISISGNLVNKVFWLNKTIIVINN